MSGDKSGSGYEVIDVPTRPIFGFGIALAAIVLITAGILQWQFQFLSTKASSDQRPLHPLAPEVEVPPEPRLLADPTTHYADYLDEQRARLIEPAWVEEESQTVRIPIERAIELVVEEGLDPR